MMHSVAKFLSFNFSQLARGEATEAAWAPAPPRAPFGAAGLGRISLLQSFFLPSKFCVRAWAFVTLL